MFEFNKNSHSRNSGMNKEDIILQFLDKNRFLELYFLICIGISHSFLKIISELQNREDSVRQNPAGLVRKGELVAIKEDIIEMVEKTEDIYSFDLDKIIQFYSSINSSGVSSS